MKKYILIFIVALLTVNCNGQNKETKKPIGSWKVDKEFDEKGKLIRYDSIYSWSSNDKIRNLSSVERDSLLQSIKSKFYNNYSDFAKDGFEDIFLQDSVFNKQYFNNNFFESDFGKELMDIDKIRQQMINRQQEFLKKYHSEFVKPEEKK